LAQVGTGSVSSRDVAGARRERRRDIGDAGTGEGRRRVNIDYHVEVDHHFYSVPHTLVHESVETLMTSTTVEVLHRGERVAVHQRSHARGQHTTVPAHMPASHRAHSEWSPSRLVEWAAGIGVETKAYVDSPRCGYALARLPPA